MYGVATALNVVKSAADGWRRGVYHVNSVPPNGGRTDFREPQNRCLCDADTADFGPVTVGAHEVAGKAGASDCPPAVAA